MTPRTEAIAYRIWAFAEPRGWDVTVQDIADALTMDPRIVGKVIKAHGWTTRLRKTCGEYNPTPTFNAPMLSGAVPAYSGVGPTDRATIEHYAAIMAGAALAAE